MARAKLYWAELAKRLTLERARRGWTAEYVAEVAGLGSKGTVLGAESGQRKPNTATIVKLTLAYGLPEDELLRLLRDGPRDPFDEGDTERIAKEWLRSNRAEALRYMMEQMDADTATQHGGP